MRFALVTAVFFDRNHAVGYYSGKWFFCVMPKREAFYIRLLWKVLWLSFFITAALMGIAYGVGAGTFKNDSDVMKGMGKSMETLGVYIVFSVFLRLSLWLTLNGQILG